MMTKTTTLLLSTALVLTMAKAATAECDGFYLAGRLGSAKFDYKDDRSNVNNNNKGYGIDKRRLMASGALGYRYKHVRGELEYIWRKKNNENISGITDVSFKSYSYMFVLYYDFFPYSWFTPFVNAGVGYTKNNLNLSIPVVRRSYDMKDTNFTWSLGAGISAKITNRWNLDIGYRYYDMDRLDTLNGKATITDQEVYMGLRYVL